MSYISSMLPPQDLTVKTKILTWYLRYQGKHFLTIKRGPDGFAADSNIST
jgi:hypothetical protein